jgi:hypothetical protein
MLKMKISCFNKEILITTEGEKDKAQFIIGKDEILRQRKAGTGVIVCLIENAFELNWFELKKLQLIAVLSILDLIVEPSNNC